MKRRKKKEIIRVFVAISRIDGKKYKERKKNLDIKKVKEVKNCFYLGISGIIKGNR